jgi:hypothetical protein
MPEAIKTIEEIVTIRFKRQGYWMVFNRAYNEVHAFKQEVDAGRYLNEEETDETARAEFVAFMRENFPDVKTYPALDIVSLDYVDHHPYLGSIAIDMDGGDEVYQVIFDKYDNPDLDSSRSNAVLWTITYEQAKKIYKKRVMASSDWNRFRVDY